MKIIRKIDIKKVENYINAHKDESIVDIYEQIKNKKFKDRSTEESLVYTYLSMNKKKLGLE